MLSAARWKLGGIGLPARCGLSIWNSHVRVRGGLSNGLFALRVHDGLCRRDRDTKELGDFLRLADGFLAFGVEVMGVHPRFEVFTLHRTLCHFACECFVSTRRTMEELVVIRKLEKVLKLERITVGEPLLDIRDFDAGGTHYREVIDCDGLEGLVRLFKFEHIANVFILAKLFHRIYLSIFPTDPRKRIPDY